MGKYLDIIRRIDAETARAAIALRPAKIAAGAG
jgi:hypothetical protein